MASKGQLTGMRGVYLAANMLAKHGLLASPTSRSAVGADILATDQMCANAWSIQVKTNNSSSNFWLLGKKTKEFVSESHVYVLVNIKTSKKTGESIEYFVVPSKVVARRMNAPDSDWPAIYRDKVEDFRDGWSLFASRQGR
jgi:hypothetical protein